LLLELSLEHKLKGLKMDTNNQTAPYPIDLEILISELTYRPGWQFEITDIDRGQGSKGLTFIVTSCGYNSYHVDRGEIYRVNHFFPVPPAAYNERSWCRWLLDRLLEVESHECCEFFQIGNTRPYAPHHGPGNDPYIIFEHGTDEDARTSFTGKINDE
jgi:hypothetical protein